MSTIHKTRFAELGYWMLDAGCWQVVDLTGDKPAQVGQFYPTKEALLGNLENYASEYGCELATPRASTFFDATDLARKHLGIPTLETRNSDELDFHDVAVWAIKAALLEAYRAGAASR